MVFYLVESLVASLVEHLVEKMEFYLVVLLAGQMVALKVYW